jgi:hypothetical protein
MLTKKILWFLGIARCPSYMSALILANSICHMHVALPGYWRPMYFASRKEARRYAEFVRSRDGMVLHYVMTFGADKPPTHAFANGMLSLGPPARGDVVGLPAIPRGAGRRLRADEGPL